MRGRDALWRWSIATLLPWLVAGVAAACSLGELTLSGVDRPHRLGLLPPSWVFGIAIAAAALVAILLRRIRVSPAPLLFGAATLVTWLPLPVPAVALAFAGPLRWSLWAVAAVLLAGDIWPRARWTADSWLTSPRRAPVLAAVLAAIVFIGARTLIGDRLPTGDEPHYLLLTQSMVYDRDLDVENNYTRRDYAPYYSGDLEPHWYVRGVGNRGILYHLPGVSALIAPAFVLGGSAAAAVWLALLAAAGTALVWLYGHALTGDPASAWFGWATAALTLPLVAQAGMVYPDAPGAILVAGVLLALASDERARRTRRPCDTGAESWPRLITALLGLGCGVLPWLHTRLALPAAFGALCLLLRMRTWHRRWSHATIMMGPFLAGIASWLWYFRRFYGVWDPRAPYGSQTPFEPLAAMAGVVATFADQQAGLLLNAPVYVLAGYAVWLLARAAPRLATEYAIVAVPYLVLSAGFHMWWGGTSVPGRLILPVLLPFAAGTALAWKASRGPGRLAGLCLLVLSALAAGSRLSGADGSLLMTDGAGRNHWLDWLSPIVDLTPGLPGYFSAFDTLLPDALIWAVMIGAFVGAGRWLSASLPMGDTARAALYVAAGCAGALGAVEVLWTRSQAEEISPTASQLAVLSSVRDRGVAPVLDVDSAAWLKGDDALARLEIGSGRFPPHADAPGLEVSGVPPGRFLVEAKPDNHSVRRLSLWIGRSSAPLEEWPGEHMGSASAWELTLPAGASAVIARAAPADRAAPPRVTLRPLALFPAPGNAVDSTEVARRAARYGDLRVFTFEDNVWLEPQSAWIAGAQAGRFVVSAPEGRSRVGLTIRAGPPGARVSVQGPGLSEDHALGPMAATTMELPVDERSRATWVTVRIDRGFRPADVDPGSRDRRYLGCLVVFR